jgi:hypothetical protein
MKTASLRNPRSTCRFKTAVEECMPVVAMLELLGKVRRISSVPPVDQVFTEVKKQLDVSARLLPLRQLNWPLTSGWQ